MATNKTKPADAVEVALKPVKAVYRINGEIEPGTIFTPASEDQRKELFDLEAVVELTDDEATLFDARPAAPAAGEGEDFQ